MAVRTVTPVLVDPMMRPLASDRGVGRGGGVVPVCDPDVVGRVRLAVHRRNGGGAVMGVEVHAGLVAERMQTVREASNEAADGRAARRVAGRDVEVLEIQVGDRAAEAERAQVSVSLFGDVYSLSPRA